MMPFHPRLRLCLIAPALLVLAACAQQPAPPRQDADLAQAQRQAMGRDTGRAAAQLQLALDKTSPAAGNDAPSQAVAHAKTFLGTIPCQNDACEASRINLTLAPAGHWRARSTTLALPPRDTSEQGCWEVVNVKPLRIVLLNDTGTVRANLGFEQDNILRVLNYNGVQPLLEYRLTQQAEIDPIDELKGRALADCRLPDDAAQVRP